MKKIIISFAIIVLISSGISTIASQKNYNDNSKILTENIEISKPIFIEKEKYITIQIDESESYMMEAGRPLLPIITKTFTFPLGTIITNTKVENEIDTYVINGKIIPCLIPEILDTTYNNHLIEHDFIDKKVYNSNTNYPGQRYYTKTGAGLENNQHVLFYTVYVVPQYKPTKNIISIPKEIKITINYLPPNKPLFTTNSEYEMVIISPQKFSSNIQPLVDHKNSVGIPTFIKSMEEIYSEYNGRDKPEQIKYFIKDAIENFGVKYVLIIGDLDHVPMRKTAVSWDYFGNVVVPDVITDLYYSDIYNKNGSFSLWDTNNDGIYSEIHMIMNYRPYNETLKIIDNIEGIPDVIVGRLPCSNVRDVQNVVKKIITYETSTYGNDWFERLILIGGDTFPSVGGLNEGEYVTDYIASVLSDFTPIRLWTSQDTFKPMSINKEISKGAGFVSYSGHGFEYGFATSEPDNPEPIFYYLPYVLGIQNKQRYPVMYFDACLTGRMDYTFHNLHVPCLAWSMIKKHNSGAVACIASTRVGYGGFAGDPFMAGTSCLHRYFYEAYEPGIHLGDMFIQAQQQFIANIMNQVIYEPLTIQEFTLLGDPSLKIGGYR